MLFKTQTNPSFNFQVSHISCIGEPKKDANGNFEELWLKYYIGEEPVIVKYPTQHIMKQDLDCATGLIRTHD